MTNIALFEKPPVMKRILLNLLGLLAACQALNLHLINAYAQVITLANPTPAPGDSFGCSVAAVGTDRVLIGAYGDADAGGGGAAYLFNTNGTLLTTFADPTPAAGDWFGCAVAAVGINQVLIGADGTDLGAANAGAAYLFSTNGVLLTTFTNPAPAPDDLFGCSVTALGTDRVLIGAVLADTGAHDSGAAYLFSANGTLLTTFTNPAPADSEYFGRSAAGVGIDQVLIGADGAQVDGINGGAAYLFDTNGALLATFTNPAPVASSCFGFSVAAVGTDRVLIGAYRDATGGSDAGAAYLFSTSGTLLATFTNPAPADFDSFDLFGWSVAAVGTDRVLIGSLYDDTGADQAGAAYLINTSGTLLSTFANPTPAGYSHFAVSVAAVGDAQAVIGAEWDNTGAYNAGAAYLFSLEITPLLSIAVGSQPFTVSISWPMPAQDWILECTNKLPSTAADLWPPVPNPYETNAGTISVTLTNDFTAGSRFFRLHKP